VSQEPVEAKSVGEIVGDIARDLGTLMRQELDLAKTEIKQEAAKAGKGAGMLGGAGVAGHLALIFLSLVVMFALGNVMDLAWAALIVAIVWAVVAAVLAATGRKHLRTVDPKLEATTETLKEDARWAKNSARSS
jgi:uncharacterized membrane protein YqjE